MSRGLGWSPKEAVHSYVVTMVNRCTRNAVFMSSMPECCPASLVIGSRGFSEPSQVLQVDTGSHILYFDSGLNDIKRRMVNSKIRIANDKKSWFTKTVT